MNGVVAFNMDDLIRFKEKYPDQNRILVRPDTVPDDIGMIFECDGMITGRGGATSHSAVTAGRLGKTCVVSCRAMKVLEDEKRCIINDVEFKPGDPIAIDGRLGKIRRGHFPIDFTPLELP